MGPLHESSSNHLPAAVKDPQLVWRRRRQLADAAVKLFIRNGFHKTTIRQIAAASGLAIGTIYDYIRTKEDLLYLVCQAIHQEMHQRLASRITRQGVGAKDLETAIKIYFSVCDQMSDYILLIYQETKSLPPEHKRLVMDHELEITQVFSDLLSRGVNDYSIRPLAPHQQQLMAHNIMVLGHMWAFRRWALGRLFSLEEYTRLQVELIMGQLI